MMLFLNIRRHMRWLLVASGLLMSAVVSPEVLANSRHHSHHHGHSGDPRHMVLLSATALVVDEDTQKVIFAKNPESVNPIASITKLMTAMVVLKNHQNLDEKLTITQDDVDTLRYSHSHLRVGTQATRLDFLRMALVASENRAAAALARNFVGGSAAFIQQMNQEAQHLGMKDTHFDDANGLHSSNVSTAHDLALLVDAAVKVPLIHQITSQSSIEEPIGRGGRLVTLHNTNPLIDHQDWQIGLSKTGFINEAGQCLVMQATIRHRPTIIVLLNSHGHHARFADAIRVRHWLETQDTTLGLAKPATTSGTTL
ncbi:MAG: serine hydrolase [Betaproteobacteria bacterium]|nr:serine hydrolase [Betaproteobacteria bacterium]